MAVYTIQIVNESEPSKSYLVPLQIQDGLAPFGPTQLGGIFPGAAGADPVTYTESTHAFWASPPPPPGHVFGLARQDDPASGHSTRETFNVAPVTQFFVADGLYTPGGVIDVTAPSTGSAQIDFTSEPRIDAKIVLAADGGFSVTYG